MYGKCLLKSEVKGERDPTDNTNLGHKFWGREDKILENATEVFVLVSQKQRQSECNYIPNLTLILSEYKRILQASKDYPNYVITNQPLKFLKSSGQVIGEIYKRSPKSTNQIYHQIISCHNSLLSGLLTDSIIFPPKPLQ